MFLTDAMDAMEKLTIGGSDEERKSKGIPKNEERLTVDVFSLLLASCLKPGVHQNGCIEKILEILQTGQLDALLLSPRVEPVDWISDLVRCPIP